MKIIYCSCVCSEKTFEMLFSNSKNMPGQQVQKYSRILLKGLSQQKGIIVEAISKLPINAKNLEKKIVTIENERWEAVDISYLPYINIPKISNLFQLIIAFLIMCKKSYREKTYVLLDVLNISMGLGIVWACKLKKNAINRNCNGFTRVFG